MTWPAATVLTVFEAARRIKPSTLFEGTFVGLSSRVEPVRGSNVTHYRARAQRNPMGREVKSAILAIKGRPTDEMMVVTTVMVARVEWVPKLEVAKGR
jgi:hypothetical protein